MKSPVTLAILAVALVACGDQPNDPDFIRHVATDVKNDCLKALSQAPNQAMQQHLKRLCDCTEQKILATPMGSGDNDQTINEKVQTASQICLDQVGGAPGEKSR